jgi:RNA polymerase-binding transcription factor DksA
MITERELKDYKRRLLNLEKELKERLKVHRKRLTFLTNRGTGENVYSDHMAEMASLGTQREREVMLMERDWRALMEVQAALKRVKEGTYGFCLYCGKPIERERLDLIPFTKSCAKCSR